MKKYKCPCCGFNTLDEPPGHYDICPVCFWEDDWYQKENPNDEGGPNLVSLNQARINFIEFGACEKEMKKHTRDPLPEEM